MKLHRLRIRPLSPWLTPWQADTLAGLLCWTCQRTLGDEVLRREILLPAQAGEPPFVLSDAFPEDHLPAPMALRLFPFAAGRHKRLKRLRWLQPGAFQKAQRGEITLDDLPAESAPEQASVWAQIQLRNTLDRRTDTTPQGAGLFARREHRLADTDGYLSIYVRVRSGFEDRLLQLMQELSLVGYGEDISVGKGQFELLSAVLEPTAGLLLDEVTGANTVISLSSFQPAQGVPLDGAWELFTKYGKLGPDFGVADVFKRPLVLMRPGACLRSAWTAPARYMGRLVPMDELLSHETAGVLRARGVDVAQLAFGVVVPAVLPWHELLPPEPAAELESPGARDQSRKVAPTQASVPRQIVLLLDIEGDARQDEVLALLPWGSEPPRCLRASEFGAPRVERRGAAPPVVDWDGLGQAMLRLAAAARAAAIGQKAAFWISGLAPLPVFVHMGMQMSAWAGPQTMVNWRKDGAVDVLPLQGARPADPFFDVIAGLSLDQPANTPGRVAIFISTGLLPEREKLRAFVLEGGQPFAGLVEIRTRAFKFLDQAHAASAADELAQYLSLVPGVYPYHQGVVLFIAGPASLAYLAGRATNPNVLGSVWVANRNNQGPSGHELALVLPLRASAEPGASEATPIPQEDLALSAVRIEELRLSHFRSMEDACLRLSDLTMLVGRNGAGKTTLLEALDFLRDAVTDGLQTALDRQGGFAGIRQRMAGTSEEPVAVGLAVVLRLPDIRTPQDAELIDDAEPSEKALVRRALYGIRISEQFTEEVLRTVPGDLSFIRRDGEFTSTVGKVTEKNRLRPPSNDLMLRQVEGLVPQWRLITDALRGMRTYSLSPPKIREEPAPGPQHVVYLDRYGANSGDILRHLEANPTEHAWLVRHLAAITPGIVGVRAGLESRRRVIFFDQQVGEGDGPVNTFRAMEMSDGTLRSLGVLLALRQASRPSLVFIDEIEDSVHPGALGVLLEAAQATVEEGRGQVVLSSHSPEALKPPVVTGDRVRIVEWRRGVGRIFNLSQGTRESLIPPDTVGDLLRINALYADETPCGGPEDFFDLPDEA